MSDPALADILAEFPPPWRVAGDRRLVIVIVAADGSEVLDLEPGLGSDHIAAADIADFIVRFVNSAAP